MGPLFSVVRQPSTLALRKEGRPCTTIRGRRGLESLRLFVDKALDGRRDFGFKGKGKGQCFF